jgi:hypothetical protein
VRGAVNKVYRQSAARRVKPAVSQFGLQNARCAGADKDANALCTVLAASRSDRIGKTVLLQAQQRKPVVTAIKGRQLRWKLHGVHTQDLANKRFQIDRIKRAGKQSSALLAQGGEGLLETATYSAGRGEMGEPERVQKKTSRSK